MKHPFAIVAVALLAGALALPSARAADADATGLVPTIWWDFETRPNATGLTSENKGSVAITFTGEGTATYQTGVTNGWAVDTSKFTPYSKEGTYSTSGNPITVSAVMTLGTNPNGITLNVRTTAGDLIIRRGATEGSLVVAWGAQKAASSQFLNATFADGDAAWHLVSVVGSSAGTALYVDGQLADSSTAFSPWGASGKVTQMQFGSHLNGPKTGEARLGGLVDDLRIHDAALTSAQMKAIAIEYGIVVPEGHIAVRASGEPTVGKNTFSATWSLAIAPDDRAEAALVYGSDAALSTPTTNALGSALSAGDYTASLAGLSPGTTYWWKIVASNGVNRAETGAASFRTLDEIVPTDYASRIPAAISGYAGTATLTNFPVLVKLAAGTPEGFDYADCAEDGADIRFAVPDGTVLPHEIDTWNTNGESLVWVKIPAISGTATAFSMYYDAPDPARLPPVDPHDVWTAAGHRAVWHFAADATESAQGLVASTATGTPSYENDGAVGKCWQSAGEAWLQYANEASWSRLGPGSTLTISVWAKFDSSSYGYNRILSTMSTWEQPAGYELTIQNSKNQVTVGSSGRSQYQKVVSPGPSDEMVYLTAVYNADTYADLYVNGVLQEHKQLNQVVQPMEAMTVACVGNGGNVWNGRLDELRLHAAAESADWVKACYDTMATPTSFVTLSPAESTNPDLPHFGAISAADANGVATFTVALDRPGCGGAVPTAVSVFYGTDGETWTELSLGSTNGTATLTGSVSGFAVGTRILWYAVATATSGGTSQTTASAQRSFVTRAFDPTGDYKSFTATVVWDGAPAENLPFLLRISEGGINGFDYDDVTASGLEILDAEGHLLPFEIDTWNTNGESLVWVLPPVYEDGATVTVRYGAPFANAPLPATNVWTAYVAVWHMNEILVDAESGNHYTPDSSASGWHAYKSDEADTVLSPVTTAPGASAHPTPLTGTAMNIAYGAGKSSSSLGGFRVPADQTSSTTLDGPGFTLSAIVNSQQAANNGRCRVIAFGNKYNDKANCSVGGDDIYCMGNEEQHKTNPKGATDWVYAADVFNSPNSKIYADGVCLSASNEGKPNLASLTLDKGIGLGCFADGTQCLDGYLDEARIRNAASTADWIAAEYHTVADGAVSFSSVSSSDAAAPVLGVPSVARNPDGSFTVSVAVSENAPASIACTIGRTDYAMTPADAALPTTYSATVDDLAPGTHVASVRATATSGTVVSSTCPDAFHAGTLTIVKISDADEGPLSPGVFRVSRADADSTGLPALAFDVAFSGAGLAAIADPGLSSSIIPAGAAYVDIVVTPVPTDEVDEDAPLSLTVSGTKVGLPSTASLTVVNAGFDLAVRYVSPEGDDTNSGGTPESPKLTIAAAVAAVNPVATSRPCTVHVAPGLYPIASPIVVTNAISVLADDPDPARTVVSNTVIGGWGAMNRIFTINHAGALVANLSMQNGNVNGSDHGGNFNVGSAGGIVSNCVVEAGKSNGNLYGAGARLSGGLVTHTIFRKNNCGSGMGNWQGQHGAVLELYGSSRAENCLLVDNPPSGTVYLSLIGDSAVMRNCTIADTGLSKTNEYCKVFTALRITSANATVLNTVIAGVTNTIDGAACPPTGSVAKFLNGAFDGDATDLPAGTVTGTIDDFFPRHAEAAAPFEARYRPSGASPLRDAGADDAPMAAFDLSGRQSRHVGAAVDIGCYEDSYLRIESTGEPEVGLDSFVTGYVLESDIPAAVRIVWSADASFADASTNTIAAGVTNGVGEASIGGLETDADYWWKLVADDGAVQVETAPASFRTLGAPTFGEVAESVDGATVQFSVGLASLARDELGNRLRTYVTVYYTTNGTDYVEKSLGSASWARAVTGTATLPNGDCTWYARAFAESGGRTLEARTGFRTFRVFHNETPPTGFHRLDATIVYAGEPAEDIPVLLRLSESIEGFRYADVANNGKDFLFSDQDGNLLPYEIDTWNPAGESLVWVRVPVFADGTVIHLDYGASEADGTADAADVWRRYVGVWHLGETTAASEYGSYPNSTAVAGIDGEKAEASAAGQPGFAGQSVRICNTATKTGAYGRGGVFVPDSGEHSPLDLGGTFAISGWFNHKDQNFYYDRLFYKRQKADNSKSSPAGAFAIEMSANNNATPKLDVRGTQNSATATPTLPASPLNAWTWLTFVYNGKTASVYENGAPVGSYSVTAAKDNDAPLCFGNDTDGRGAGTGTAAWCGWIDEVRLAGGVPTAAWLAAEHAAMAPEPGVVRFAPVRDLEMPVLDGAPDLSWGGSTFRYAATVAYGLGDVLLTTVNLFDGAATTNVAQSFDSVAQLPHAFSDPVSLGENRMYRAVAVLRSSDGTEEALAAADRTVYSGQLAATWIADANIAAMTPAIVRLSRADTEAAVCADLTVSVELSGEAVSKGLLEPVVSATIPAGTNSVDVAIRPIARSVAPGDYGATLTVTGTNVANPAGTHVGFDVLNAGADPYVRFVAPDGDDGNDGALATSPKRTIAGALASFSDAARSVLCTVHVAPGLYPIESPIVLTNAVRVLGDDPDPSRVVVSNTVGANWTSGNQRIFTISHPDALVANLTMQKGSVWGDWTAGGNFFIGTPGGTVSNCVVEAGAQVAGHAGAGGGYLEGGLVTHTVFRRNETTGSSPYSSGGGNKAAVLELSGSGRAENCLIADNPQWASVILVKLGGSSTMRNCTIADSVLPSTNDVCKLFSALRIDSSAATAQNVVIAGVTNTIDGAPCPPTGSVARFRNGAFDGDASSLPAETVVGSPASFFRNRARGDYRPKSGGPLVNAGVNYEPMAGVDLTGVQPRKVGSRVDIGCFEGFAETTILILR